MPINWAVVFVSSTITLFYNPSSKKCAFLSGYMIVFLLFCSDVRNNSLTGSIPENIGNCTAFQVLYVIQLHDFDIPCSYFLFTFLISSVDARDLSYNQLTGEIPFNIGFLQVATLYVCMIFFKFFFMRMIFGLSLFLSWNFLIDLLEFGRSLQGNKLSGHIPPVIGLMQALAVL